MAPVKKTTMLTAIKYLFCIWGFLTIFPVNAQLVVSFRVENDCQFTKRFIDQSTTGPNDSIKTRYWNFGDGNDSTSSKPSLDYRYIISGIVKATLFVTTWKGDTASDYIFVVIKPAPVSNFKFSFNCFKNQIIFKNTSTVDTPFAIVEEYWEFDGGDTLRYSGKRDTVIYNPPAAGPRKIRLTTTASNGCTHTVERDLVYPEKPDDLFQLIIPKACPNEVAKIQFKLLVPVTYVTYITFLFGPGDSIGTNRIDTLKNIFHTFKNPGKFAINSIIQTEFGCTHYKDNDSIEILQNPTAQFDFFQGCTPDSFFFVDQSIGNGTTIISRQWQLGEGRTSTQLYPIIRYGISGSIPVTLTVKNNLGCSQTITKTVTVPNPLIPFIEPNVNNVCINTQIQFNIPGLVLDTAISAHWYFGDGEEDSINRRPQHAYTKAGNYRVRCIIHFQNGCIWTCQTYANVMVTKDLYMLALVNPIETSFENARITGTDSTLNGAQWHWDMGDGTTYSTRQINHHYNDTGVFPVKLRVNAFGGCADSGIFYVKINPVWKFKMPDAFSPDGNVLNDVFKPVGSARHILEYNFRIYSRWGQKIFESHNFDEGWNGNFFNQDVVCPDGIYLYIVELLDDTRTDHIFKGPVFLLRRTQ